AAALESAAARAVERGAPAAAAELFEQAARLAGDAPDRGRALVAAGRHWFVAAEPARGERALAQALDELPSGPDRAAALVALAVGVGHEVARAEAVLADALAEAGDVPELRASALALRSMLLGVLQL